MQTAGAEEDSEEGGGAGSGRIRGNFIVGSEMRTVCRLPQAGNLHRTVHSKWDEERKFCRLEVGPMYHHVKKLMYTVNIGRARCRFGNMLLEQFGGANGELAAAMQYTIQGLELHDDLGGATC